MTGVSLRSMGTAATYAMVTTVEIAAAAQRRLESGPTLVLPYVAAAASSTRPGTSPIR